VGSISQNFALFSQAISRILSDIFRVNLKNIFTKGSMSKPHPQLQSESAHNTIKNRNKITKLGRNGTIFCFFKI
jgi:hypothetical protein